MQATQVTWIAGSLPMTGFWTIMLMLYASAASRASATPTQSRSAPSPDVASAMTTTPANAIASPGPAYTEGRSWRNTTARTVIRIGANWIRMLAVPASIRVSAALSATL